MLGEAARQIQMSDLKDADLVLASDQAVVTEILRSLPHFRPKIFTIREGAALADAVGSSVSDGVERGYSTGTESVGRPVRRLQLLRAEMDAWRGQVALPHHRGTLVGRSRRTMSNYDVMDIHRDSSRQHRHMVSELSAGVNSVASVMAAFVAE